MTIEQMAPRDAQMYWMSTKIPNDQFLLFCFDSPTADLDTVRSVIAARAADRGPAGTGCRRRRAPRLPVLGSA